MSSLINKIYKKLDELNTHTGQYISSKHAETINQILKTDREELKNLNKAIRTRKGAKQEELFRDIDFRLILKVFPIWLVKMNDIHRVLPLYRELFDIALIDITMPQAPEIPVSFTIPKVCISTKYTCFGREG